MGLLSSAEAVGRQEDLAAGRSAALTCPVLVRKNGQDVAVVLKEPDLLVGDVRLVATEGAADDARRRVQLHHLLQTFGTDAVQAAQHFRFAGARVEAVVADLAFQFLHRVKHRCLGALRLRV